MIDPVVDKDRRDPAVCQPRGELVIDSFAGGGGASLGIEQAIGRPVDIAINHDATAIASRQTAGTKRLEAS